MHIDSHPDNSNPFTAKNIRECSKYVRTIQMRLDKAVENDDKSKIKFYTHILSKRSRAAKILAVNRICKENDGRYTAGTDGIAMSKDDRNINTQQMKNLLESIDITAKPDTIRRVYIPKPNGKQQPLGIPTIKDRINQEIIRQAIEPISEYHFSGNSYGFRPKRSIHDAIGAIFIKQAKRNSDSWVVEGDIEGCFDNIKHSHIIDRLEEWNVTTWIRDLIGKMLRARIVEGNAKIKPKKGTPQGGVISPMLANIALTCIDEHLQQLNPKTPLTRYADDFIIYAKDEAQANRLKEQVKSVLKDKVGLNLSDEKTHITHISNGYDFLGFNIRKYKDKLLIKPSKESIESIRKKLKDKFKVNQNASADSLIRTVQPIPTGWANNFRHVIAKDSFGVIDDHIYRLTSTWSSRKHPTRTNKWIKTQYFNNDWNLHDRKTRNTLHRVESTPIRRHVKVNNEHRVYNNESQDYWDKRDYLKAKNSIIEDTITNKLFHNQKGKCTHCRMLITQYDIQNYRVHKHHIIPKANNGNNNLGNLQLLHSNCHYEIHSH